MAANQQSTGKVIEVSAGLVFDQGRLLITQRRSGDHLGNLWEFPGGKRESGETFEQCLARELKEELDILVDVEQLLETIQHSYPEKTVLLKFYRCRLIAGDPKPLGCKALAWVTAGELASYQFPAADENLLSLLHQDAALWNQ